MSKKSLNLKYALDEFNGMVMYPEKFPVKFTYAGKTYTGFGDTDKISGEIVDDEKFRTAKLSFRIDGNMRADVTARYCIEFGEIEYTVWFENDGKDTSSELKDIYVLYKDFGGAAPMLRGNLGDHDNWYSAYENDLLHGDSYFCSNTGRSTHIVFPYFDFVHGDGGTLMAIGWAGTWDGLFSAHDNVTSIRLKTNYTMDTVLLPGEKIRTGLMVMIPYSGRNADNATNLWREWFMKYNLPKANAAGDPLKPFITTGFSDDTGLPNSDGSISERSTTWKRTLDKIIAENVKPDFRWFDAGWYCDPAGNTVETDWWGTTGTWELDKVKWPGETFKESNIACHKAGMKVLTWFEPERVTHLDDLCKNFGYKKEWAAVNGPVITSNIGDEECLQWTLGRITKMLGDNEVDMYREDNNSDPVGSWAIWDRADREKYGLPRNGINENKCINGHYRLWDGIIDFCAKNGKCTFVDSCASGGGRNDIESMRRGFPLMRSDYDRTTTAMRLSQTTTFCKWIPFHGSTMKETEDQLGSMLGKGSDEYIVRASYLPIYNNTGVAYNENKDLDFDLMRKNIAEWKSVSHLLTKDMYVLTPWHHNTFTGGWTAIAYDDPDANESLLLAFRMETAESKTQTVKLPFAERGAEYNLENADTKEQFTVSGDELADGVELYLPTKKSSVMFRIKRV